MELSEIDLHDDVRNEDDECDSPPHLQMSINFRENANETMTLIWTQTQCLRPKHFGEEVRATMDVSHFLNQSVPFLIDMNADSLPDIVNRLLEAVLVGYEPEEAERICQEAKSSLFADDAIQQFASIIQVTTVTEGGSVSPEQGWLLATGQLASLQRRHVAIARLNQPINLEPTVSEARFVIIVLAPHKEKGTKNAVETGRTFATLFADVDLRNELLRAATADEFKKLMLKHTQKLRSRGSTCCRTRSSVLHDVSDLVATRWQFGAGIVQDVKRRWPHYLSDYVDGITGQNTLQKVISSIIFLYFACLLPAIAFGVLYGEITNQQIGVKKLVFTQAAGGILFAIFGGQPMIILLSTAPLALFTKVIFTIAEEREVDGLAFYSCIGLWNAAFLVLYSVFNLSKVMQWATRHTEEIFALFISIAYTVDSIMQLNKNFKEFYRAPSCYTTGGISLALNATNTTGDTDVCHRDHSLLYLALLLGTVSICSTLYEFRKSPYLDTKKREFLSDYALPVAIIVMSFVGSYLAGDIKLERFVPGSTAFFEVPNLASLSADAIFLAMVMGFALSLLFFMDQNISSAIVNSPKNNLQKGSSYHWDLIVVAAINGLLSLFGLGWLHAALPHSPLHVHSLADVDERVDQGHVYDIIVRVRETRLTGLLSHVLIALSLLMVPVPLHFIPKPVLYGLFVCVALMALNGNQLFERILLFVTEQYAYPPNHYIRRVPQRKIHLFTTIQLCQLAVVCFFGFFPNPYVKMIFPAIILLLLPARYLLVPKLIDSKYLSALDGNH